jgi:hypothetical protein
MARRSFTSGLLAALGVSRGLAVTPQTKSFPPVPAWRPSFDQPLDRIVDRVSYYTDGKRDYTVFRNGTCVILEPGLSDAEANTVSFKVLSDIFNYHPDMNPSRMDDGNILVRYNHPAINVVLGEVARAHWQEVEERHLDGLATSEVLMTPLGPNRFDDLGKQALLGRAYMFMDAQAPEMITIKRQR